MRAPGIEGLLFDLGDATVVEHERHARALPDNSDGNGKLAGEHAKFKGQVVRTEQLYIVDESTTLGQRIAHGTLVFTVAVGLTAGDVNPEAFTYGYDRLRFIKPVFIGDTLHVKVTLKEKRDAPKRPGYGFVIELLEAANQRHEVVMVCEHLLMVKRAGGTS